MSSYDFERGSQCDIDDAYLIFVSRLGCKNVVAINDKDKTVTVKQAEDDIGRSFTYDFVYDWNSTQRQVYDQSAFGLVESVLEGYNGKIFISFARVDEVSFVVLCRYDFCLWIDWMW